MCQLEGSIHTADILPRPSCHSSLFALARHSIAPILPTMSTTNNTDKTPGEGTPPCPKAAKETLPVLKAKKKTPSSMDVNLSSGSV